MNTLKVILACATIALSSASALAQNGSNSSYSRFGLGTIAEQSQTFNRGMGGVALGLRNGSRVNMQNPASYSCVDSLSFIFDVGMTMQYGHMSTNGTSTNARNTTLSNVNAGFRVGKNIGMSFGFVPYTTIGYTFNTEGKVGNIYTSASPISTKTTYTGNGGLQELYLGVGWAPFSWFSVGANVGYLWGDYNHSTSQVFYEGTTSSTNYSSQNQIYSADLASYKADFGVQVPITINKYDKLTLGATYSLGHGINGTATRLRYTTAGDSASVSVKNTFDIPTTFGGGVSWQHKDVLTVAADMHYEKWAECKTPVAGNDANGDITYETKTGAYQDRTRYNVGAEYIPNIKGRHYMETVQYRMGFSYSTPYLNVNGQDGPAEYRASVGLGLPLGKVSGRSVINVSAEWMMRKPSVANMIKENYVMLNIGISFNERWFLKWKIN